MKIAVIGGGAAGLMSAVISASYNADVTILERTDRVGKKILATGNGRCNMTNIYADVNNYHGANPKFVMSALNNFNVSSTMDFFSELGILCKTEDGGKVYPYSNQASSVLDVLRMKLESLGVNIITGFDVMDIIPKNNEFTLKSYTGETVKADRVIVATGGKASPNLGSNGSGYDLLKKLGHTVTDLFPALVQVKTDTEYVKSLKGTKFDGKATLKDGKKTLQSAEGEILFTEYGLSGPPLFALSRKIAEAERKNKTVTVLLDMMSEYSREQVYQMLAERIAYGYDKTLENFFIGMLNKRLGQVLLKSCGIAPLSRKCATLSEQDINNLTDRIKGWEFVTHGTTSWNNAQVTAGGINTKEVSPQTMESKIVKGLFIVGELLDIDGDCGGFNLQWAWSSGYTAGIHASE